MKEAGLTWFEDMTNNEQTYGRRNAVRFLLKSRNMLPYSLQPNHLSAVLGRLQHLRNENAKLLDDISAKYFSLKQYPESGHAIAEVDCRLLFYLHSNVLARILQSFATKIQAKYCTGDFTSLADWLLESRHGQSARRTLHGILWANKVINNSVFLTLSRQPYAAVDYSRSNISMPLNTVWSLWDNRYWFRMVTQKGNLMLQPVTKAGERELSKLAKSMTDSQPNSNWAKYLDLPKDIRICLPSVKSVNNGKIVALPSLDLYLDGDVKVEWSNIMER